MANRESLVTCRTILILEECRFSQCQTSLKTLSMPIFFNTSGVFLNSNLIFEFLAQSNCKNPQTNSLALGSNIISF